MIKHSRKRQKLDDRQPLGSSNRTAAASEKDDEERRLEELIFGVPFVPSAVNAAKSRTELVDDDDEGEGIHSTGKEMDGLLDSDIFFVDDGGPPPPPSASQSTRDEDDTNNLERGSDDNGSDDEPSSQPPPLDQSTSRKAAWSDPADAPLAISVAPSDPSTSKRALKLRDSQNETVLSGREYERRLRRQFTKINPEPIWALKARDKIHGQVKRRRSSQSGSEVEQDDSENEDSNIDHLLTSTSGVLRKGRSSKFLLPPTTLNINRLRDANQSVQSNACGDIKSLAFHPKPHVPLLCVASKDNRYRLFQVDGHTSPLLQTLHIPSLPPTSTSTTFHPSGGHLLLTGARPYYFTYDLQAQRMTQSARGLWGTTFSGANDSSIRADRGKRGRGKDGGEPIQHHAFHPSDGSLLAVAGRGGYVHLVDWGSGSGQVIDSLKMSSAVKGLWWGSLPMGFSDDDGQSVGGGDYLVSLSNDSEVYIWDVGSRRCVRRWRDEGGFRGAGLMLAGSAHGGQASHRFDRSNTGLVNVYGSDALAPSPNRAATSSNPKPHKTLGQLVTSVTSLRFNRDGQILAMASREKKDALRLVHAHSLTAFANWPTASTPLGHVTSIDFSAGNDHMAVGNSRGKVLLYQLRDYGV